MTEGFIIRRAVSQDVDELESIMEVAKQTVKKPEWFVADDRSWLESHIENQGFTMAAEAQDGKLAGFFIVAFPDEGEKNLGHELKFVPEKLCLTAHMDSAAVRPEYRGHHLQGRLLEAAERELCSYPYEYLFCTVHPENYASLHTMLNHDYVVIATKKKYHGYLRHILYKKKEKEYKERPNILVSACLVGVHCRYNEKGVMDQKVMGLMERANLIPVCPELFGGLSTPREPAERSEDKVMTITGQDVTREYEKGARETLELARVYGCRCAVLKERSPSCGSGMIYDGTYSGNLIKGDGVTAELLKKEGIQVIGESEAAYVYDFI